MDYVISHDFTEEVLPAVRWIREHGLGVISNPNMTPILLHTRYNRLN